MNALAPRESAEIVQADGATLMQLISRAATDPSFDADKMERMLSLYERITAKQAEQAFNDAMNVAQSEMKRVAADKHNNQTHSDYTSYAALDRAVRPIYARNGFSLTFNTAPGAPQDNLRVTCRVAHSAGHAELYQVDMPADGKGAKGGDVMTRTHATGAAMTYGQRYLLKLIFNLAIGEDDDGNAASGPKEMGEAARHALTEINACETAADLAAWKKNKAAGLQNILSAGELKEVIGTFNRRVEAMKSRSADHDA